jgi:hypothetical protein
MHTQSSGQGSFSSQRPSLTGAHAATQSLHAGQLELAHSLHTSPGAHASQTPGVQGGAHCPVAKMQIHPVQSSCVVQKPGPVLELTATEDDPVEVAETALTEAETSPLLLVAPVDVVLVPTLAVVPGPVGVDDVVGDDDVDGAPPSPPWPPPSSSKTTVPPHAVSVRTSRKGSSRRIAVLRGPA